MASNGVQRSLSAPGGGEVPRGGPAGNNRPAPGPGHGRPIARPTDDIQVKLNGTLNGHGGRKRHFNRDEPRRHTLGGPRSQMEMKRENSEMEKLERQRQAFLEHLKKKYPQHAQAISGHQKQTRTLSSSHVAEVMEEEDRASVASEQSEPPMGTATAGFSRGSRLRSSLPVVRTPILSKEKSKGIVYLQVNDETKRSIMPNEVTGLDTVRAMFVRAFPHRLTMQIMEQPHVKIYIRDSKSDVYYELEEMKEVQDRACLKIHVPGLADTLPMYHTPSPNSTLSSTTVSNVSLVIEEDGTDSVRNGPSPRPDMARHSPRYQTAVHNTSHQTYQMIKQSNEQKIQQLSNHVSESGSSSEHSTPKQQSPQSTVQRQPHPYQSRGPPPPMSGPPKPAHAAPPPPASPRHTQGGAPPPQHQQQQVSRQQTAYYVSQSQAAPQHSVQPPQHGGPYPQQSSPHPQQGSPHPQQGPPHPQQGSPHPQQGSPHHPQQSSPHPQQGAPHPQQVAPHPRTSPHSPHVAQQHATYVYSAQQVPQQRGPPPQGHPQRGTPPQGRPQGHPQGHPGMPAGVPKSASMPNYYQQRPAQGPRPAGPGQPHPIQRSGSAGPPPAHAGRHPGQKMHPSQHAPAMYQRQTSGPGSGGSRASPVMGVQPRGRRSLPHLAGSDVEDEVIQQLRTGHRRGYGSSQTSGTSSPIVNDDEARKRMANIEQQIASLAGLVQTALTHGEDGSPATGAVPGTGKEEEKGRHPSVARSESSHSGFSAESVSTVSGRASSPLPDERVAEKAKRIHHTTQGLREQLNQLRIIHRHNEQEMNETFEKVKREIQVRLSRSPSGSIHPVRTQRSRVDLEMHNYRKRAEIVEKKLSELERWVEEVRTDVVNKRCRVSVGDVDAMLKALGRSEKDWRELQDTWPGLNEELKAVLSAEMEVVVQEERFVKDETDKVEGALKRIKKLTGTLHTLQRLASVQEHRPAQVPVFEQKGEPDQEKLLEDIKGLTPDHEKRLQSIQASPQPAKPPEDTAKHDKAKPEKAEPEPKESSVSETDSSPSKEEQMTLSPSSTSVSSETTSTGQSDLQESPQDQTKDSPAMKATPRPLPSPTKQQARELPLKKKPAPQPSARSPPPKQPSIPPQKQPVTPPPKQAVTPPPKQASTPPPKQIPRSVSPTKKAPSPTIPPKKENTIVAMEAKTAPPQPPVKKSPPASSPPPKKQQQSVPTPPPKPGAAPHSPPWQKEHRSVSPPMMRPVSPPAKLESPKTSPVKREPTSPPPLREPGTPQRVRSPVKPPVPEKPHSVPPPLLTIPQPQPDQTASPEHDDNLPPPTTEATLQRHNRFRALQRLKTKFMQETSPPPSPQLSSPDSRNNNKESPKFDKELKKEIKKQKKLNKKAEKQRKEEEKEEKKRKKKPPKLEMPHKEQEYSPSLVSPWERRKPLSPTLEMEFEEMEKAEGRGSEGHDPEGHDSESCSPESRDSEGRSPEGRDSEGRSPESRDSEGYDPKGRDPEGRGSEGHSSPVTPPDTTRTAGPFQLKIHHRTTLPELANFDKAPSSETSSGTTTPTGDSGLSDSLLEEQLLTQHAAEEARERRLRLGSHGPETRKLVEALKEAEETLQQAVITTDSKDKIEVLIPQESPKVENGSQHSPSGQVLEPGKKVPPPPPPRKNWITSPASPPPRSPAHSPPIISSNVQYTGKATDLDKAQTSYTTKTITTVFRSATSPTNKPASPGNHNDNNNLVTNRREGGEGAEKDQRVWFSPTPTTHTIEREEDLDPQEKKRQLQEQYNILQQLQRENMQTRGQQSKTDKTLAWKPPPNLNSYLNKPVPPPPPQQAARTASLPRSNKPASPWGTAGFRPAPRGWSKTEEETIGEEQLL